MSWSRNVRWRSICCCRKIGYYRCLSSSRSNRRNTCLTRYWSGRLGWSWRLCRGETHRRCYCGCWGRYLNLEMNQTLGITPADTIHGDFNCNHTRGNRLKIPRIDFPRLTERLVPHYELIPLNRIITQPIFDDVVKEVS